MRPKEKLRKKESRLKKILLENGSLRHFVILSELLHHDPKVSPLSTKET